MVEEGRFFLPLDRSSSLLDGGFSFLNIGDSFVTRVVGTYASIEGTTIWRWS